VLRPDELEAWLRAPRLDLLRPADERALAQRYVSERVNTPANDDEACLEEATAPRQLKLW
jgi:putative SOS response-associated peptidase YedK